TGDVSWLYGLKAFGVEPDAVEAAYSIGAQMVKQGFLDKAREYFIGLQQLDPANYRVYQWLAHIAQLQKNPLLAYQMLVQGMQSNPKDPVLRIQLGEALLMVDKQPNNGVANIERGIALAGSDPKYAAHVKRGQQLVAAVKQRAAAGAADGK